MAYLETNDLTVGYHGKPLIKDIALHVQRGRIVTLIGPNGSGKSTILKTIIGQLSKVSGTVFLPGRGEQRPLSLYGAAGYPAAGGSGHRGALSGAGGRPGFC